MWLLPECVQFGCCRPRLSDEADGGLVVQGLMHVTRAPFPYLVRGRGPGQGEDHGDPNRGPAGVCAVGRRILTPGTWIQRRGWFGCHWPAGSASASVEVR